MKNDTQTNTPTYLSPTDLEKTYGFSKSTQSKMRMARKIPFCKVGAKILYNSKSIISWIESNRVDVIA